MVTSPLRVASIASSDRARNWHCHPSACRLQSITASSFSYLFDIDQQRLIAAWGVVEVGTAKRATLDVWLGIR